MTERRPHQLSVLDSGARLITAHMPERASVAISFMFAVGSRFEEASNSGLAHFIEHMVFKGGGRFPTARAISTEIEGVGGVLNADTDRESTVFWTRVPQEWLGLASRVLADMLLRPVVDAAEVDRERLVVLEELRMTADNPQEHVNVVFDELMWPDHPLGWDIAGREETVRSFTRDQCLDHIARHYRPENLIISIAGAVDHQRARAVLEREIGAGDGSAPSERPQPLPALPPGCAGAVSLRNRRTEQSNIVIGGRSSSYRHADRHAVDVLNTLLGEGMSSRLFLELREERALAYDVHSFTMRLSDTGALAVYLGCDPSRATAAVRAAVRELERLASEPVPEEELRRAVEYLRGRLLLGLESTSGMSSHLGQQQLLTGEILGPEALMERVEAVTADDVRRVASEVMNSGLRAAVVGPHRDPARFEAALAAQ